MEREQSFTPRVADSLVNQENTVFLMKTQAPKTVLRYICALLNTQRGGVIFVGINKHYKGNGVDADYAEIIQYALKDIYPNPNNVVHVERQRFSNVAMSGFILIIRVGQSNELYQFKEPESQYYIYNKNRIIAFKDYDEAKKRSEYISSGLPYILSFEPGNTEQRLRLRKIQVANNVEIHSIGELPKGNYFYKYVDLETFLISLKTNKVRFNEPSKWSDKYESRFYNASYSAIHAPLSETPFLYAYCLTYNIESEAAWKVYSYQKQGLGAHCVELKIKRNEFREHLLEHLHDCKVYVGKVNYLNSDDINNLHIRSITKDGVTTSTELYKTYFEPFNLFKYLNLILLKRKAFEHEKEVRFLIIPNNADTLPKSRYVNKKFEDKSKPKDITIDWLDVLDGIQIDSNCSDTEREILAERINSLIDARVDLSDEQKDTLKKKLEPSPFDVYGIVEDVNIGIDINKDRS